MRKAVVLIIILGITLVLAALAMLALYIMTNEARIAEHKIRRTRAFYAAQGGIIHAIERLRREGTTTTNQTAIAGNTTDVTVGTAPAGNVDLTIANTPGGNPSDLTVNASVNY